VKERGIIFSGEMVQAVLEGHKTETRRVVRPQPWLHCDTFIVPKWIWRKENDPFDFTDNLVDALIKCCPYGAIGDKLWVRETWAVSRLLDDVPPRELEFLTTNHDFPQGTICYRADSYNGTNPLRGKWRPSIHMPRWASRLTLEVTDVRAERLRDITAEDIMAEGIRCKMPGTTAQLYTGDLPQDKSLRTAFVRLWDSLNKKRGFGYATNPWVWVVEFEILKS